MDNPLSIRERREKALSFCYGFYCMPASDENSAMQNGLSMSNSEPLDDAEKQEIIRLIKSRRDVKNHYVNMFKEYDRFP